MNAPTRISVIVVIKWTILPVLVPMPGALGPVPELSFLPAPYRGWTRAGEKRVQANLHAHVQNKPVKNNLIPTTLLASINVSRTAFLSSRSEKKNMFFDVNIVVLPTTSTPHYSFTLFSCCLYMLSEFAKIFERKVWRVQVAHQQSAALVLSSSSRCFQLATNLGKYFFRHLWYCGKKQIERGLAWQWWNSIDFLLLFRPVSVLPKGLNSSRHIDILRNNTTLSVMIALN